MLAVSSTIFSAFFAWTKTAKPIAIRYRTIPATSQRYGGLGQVGAEDEDQRDAGDALDDRARDDDAALDELATDRAAKWPFWGAFWAWLAMIGNDERRAEHDDRAHDVQEQEQLSRDHPTPLGRARCSGRVDRDGRARRTQSTPRDPRP